MKILLYTPFQIEGSVQWWFMDDQYEIWGPFKSLELCRVLAMIHNDEDSA